MRNRTLSSSGDEPPTSIQVFLSWARVSSEGNAWRSWGLRPGSWWHCLGVFRGGFWLMPHWGPPRGARNVHREERWAETPVSEEYRPVIRSLGACELVAGWSNHPGQPPPPAGAHPPSVGVPVTNAEGGTRLSQPCFGSCLKGWWGFIKEEECAGKFKGTFYCVWDSTPLVEKHGRGRTRGRGGQGASLSLLLTRYTVCWRSSVS